jgi:AcrR family transcriptional regulator
MAARKSARPIDIDAIVEATLRVADAEGLGAVSMRRIGSELGIAAMSLYHHVANKEALLNLMADQAIAALPELDANAPWQREMTRFFADFRELYLRHPAVARVMVDRPLGGPNTVARGERAIDVLIAAGFPDDVAIEAFISLANYTTGASLYEIGRRDIGTDWLGDVAADDHPTIDRVRSDLTAAAGEAQFRRGLERLISAYDRDATPSPSKRTDRRD